MSISPLPGSGFISVFRPAASVSPRDAAPVHRTSPHDPLDQHLTDGDRSAIKAATGVAYEADGGVLYPPSMSTADRSSVSRATGQIAADRADGRLSGDLSADHLSALLRRHGHHGAHAGHGAHGHHGAAVTPSADQDPGSGVDLLA